ncbi:MAG TPA: HAD family hydrolase [Candidatus Nanoarchaeia archaeon]|nr:HAD family hydrolase [Candidatus Nanoarchaeia archaeon]
MVQAILFDFWGTLVETGIHSPIKQVKDILAIDLPFSDYVVRMERAMMTSKFESLTQAFEAVCTEFHIEPTPEKIEELVGMWNKSWMLSRPYEEVEQSLAQLQSKYRLILIANTDCFSLSRALEKFKLAPYFEKMYLSFEQGILKNDVNFLNKVIEDLNVQKEDCLVVGDSMESDILAAQNAGIKAMLVDRRNRRDFNPKVCHLRELVRRL